MIPQAHCTCGAGVVGERDEQDIVQTWTKEHQKQCGQGFIDSIEYTVSLSCPHCGFRFYGREFDHDGETITAQQYAVGIRDQHMAADCEHLRGN